MNQDNQDNQYVPFEQKVRSMKISDIIFAMIESLDNPNLQMDGLSFGHKVNEICYGSFDTHFVCHVGGFNPNDSVFVKDGMSDFAEVTVYRLTEYKNHAETLSRIDESAFLWNFEDAIDSLRLGEIGWANGQLKNLNLGFIKKPKGLSLPILTNDYTDNQLKAYRQLAHYNRKLGN